MSTLTLSEDALTDVLQLAATGAAIGHVAMLIAKIGVDDVDYAGLGILPEEQYEMYRDALDTTLNSIRDWAQEVLDLLATITEDAA